MRHAHSARHARHSTKHCIDRAPRYTAQVVRVYSFNLIWKQLNARDLAASIGADHVSRSADRSLLEMPWLGNSSPTLVTRSQSESESFSLMLLLNEEAHEDLSAALRFAPDVYASGDIWVERCTWCERACMRLIFEPTIR